jgi:signal transduction histidine kinase
LSAYSASHLSSGHEVLGELLHSLSQPLTTLRCSLELSIDETAAQQRRTVAAALTQTETMITMIRFMREYLEADALEVVPAVPLMPILASVTEDLSTIAAVRGTHLQLVGTCGAELPLAESRLRIALDYLILPAIEHSRMDGQVNIWIHQETAEAVMRLECKPARCPQAGANHSKYDPAGSTTRRVRLAIATRLLESAGATLSFGGDAPGFSLRIPCVNALAD